MLSAKTQIKSVRQGENAVKAGPLFEGQSCEVFNSLGAAGCASSHCTQLLKASRDSGWWVRKGEVGVQLCTIFPIRNKATESHLAACFSTCIETGMYLYNPIKREHSVASWVFK